MIGVSALHLSSGDGKSALSKLAAMKLLSAPPPGEFEVPGAGVVKEALGYLHANCGHCHNERPEKHDLSKMRLRVHVTDKTPEATWAYITAIHSKTFHVGPTGTLEAIVPGMPDQSQLYERMGLRDDWQMPPRCTLQVDPTGLKTVRDWITALPK
ncbi:MAG: hypothetical protein EXR72_10090 [Myxococcales bacterium]|nr:hypothetical protein [Myxococcales bacterium]